MLKLHRAQRCDTLATALADLLAEPLADPFAREVIAVPAKGVERWLNQQLSARLGATNGDGIAANIDFPAPARLVETAVARSLGLDPDDDPWSPSRTVWALLAAIDDSLTEPWCAVLARHLGTDAAPDGQRRRGRRYATALQLDRLFRSYAAQRPALMLDWVRGADTDGAGAPLPDDLRWQAMLWRVLRDRIGVPSPAERLGDTRARLTAEPELLDLPTRLSVFGATRLTTDQLEVLGALGVHRDVHLWVPHPSPAMWDRLSRLTIPRRRRDDDSALAVSHPLLASLARDVRELQFRSRAAGFEDVAHPAPPAPQTLLGRIQDAITTDDTVRATTGPDSTVQVHVCHGPARQVEVLRECLLHLFADDPTLEPRDVIVMCPDIETYAPLIRASFGQGVLVHPAHGLRVRLADRALHQTNDVLAVLDVLFTIADGRITATEVLDLAAATPVRTRFGFSDDDLERLAQWTAESGARWGLAMIQRSAFGLGDFPQNTFRAALDRVLLGATADETAGEWLGLALPLDDVDSNDIDLAGRFAEYIDRLDVTVRKLSATQSAHAWREAIRSGLDLLTDVPGSQSWQRAQTNREIAEALEQGGDTELRLADMRALLVGRLSGRPTRSNFRTGELTVCTMVPMRSVPHRVVILLGLDDEVYPRTGAVDGDDVLARDPMLGERDPRSEDRQLLLDAIMSAGERLLLFFTGADPVTGSPRPPAIPLSEVIDVLERTVGATQLGEIVHRHPLQPFDPRNFRAPEPFSFDRSALAGAQASMRTPIPLPEFLPAPLPARTPADVNLDDLVNFVVHPTQGFLRQRLGIRIPDVDDDIPDALAIDLGGLDKWDIGDRMLTARLTGVEPGAFRDTEWRRGTLPPRRLGRDAYDDIERTVDMLAELCLPVHAGVPESLDVDVDLGGGRRLSGTVTGVHGTVLARSSYSRLAAKHRLQAWVRLLALAVARPDSQWTAVVTGRGMGRRAKRSTLAIPPDPATELLRLIELRDRGLCAPLPIATGASSVYADRRAGGADVELAEEAAAQEWYDTFGDAKDRHLIHVYGPAPRFVDFAAASPESDEAAWWPERSRFGVLARRLWEPLLACETLAQVETRS
ncbi:exodeoxyribonuclease V subunit gamma [Aldersonia sp. NBC_00410]|uniref:exodeoxyribonuclease V subunit gamma n=1 Tax=Aldersonia sp. NBC_00410 TaxID=2975954 RepID=UPI00225B0434|nr:exodeoxyribonuclease V subunit gamma [Aldersonia sp. NBC_00410]MCX5044395.1 exodeoxyribonuclease V subunit gamma [Aldersonia sp. NBC_00410]